MSATPPFVVVIPARYGSTRLPGKALADIHGRPMIWWVWQQACQSQATEVIIATDDERIATVMREAGAEVCLTREDHPSGTDRLAEVVNQRGWADDVIVVNVQGDEPLMPIENIDQVATELAGHPRAALATLSEPITDAEEFQQASVVKVVCNAQREALYFSRAPIPFPREGQWLAGVERHIGLYAYRAGFLREFVQWPPAAIEQTESLEQLRALYFGRAIRVQRAHSPVPPGVDTPQDLEAVRRHLGTPPDPATPREST